MLLDLASLESLYPDLRAHMAAKPNPGGRASSPNRLRSEQSAPIFDKAFYLLFLFLPLVTLIQTVLARPGERAVAPQRFSETFISGPQWSYTVPFVVRNKTTIEKLIQCESRGMNVSRPDDDGSCPTGFCSSTEDQRTPWPAARGRISPERAESRDHRRIQRMRSG